MQQSTGIQSRFLAAFSPDGKAKKSIKGVCAQRVFLMYDEESLKKRVQRVRGIQRQTETMLMLTRKPLSLPEKDRKHFRGSNKGDALGPVHVPDWSSSWALPFDAKKALYGPNRVAVGGRSDEGVEEGDDDEEGDEDEADDRDLIPPAINQKPEGRKTRDDDSLEPVFYQSLLSPTFWSEVIHSYNLRLIIHLTAGDTSCAEACMQARIGYVGITFNDHHLNALTDHLTKHVLSKFSDSGSNYFQADYVAQQQQQAADGPAGGAGAGGTAPKALPKAVPKADPKAKPKAKTKKEKKNKRGQRESSGSDSESGSSA